MACFHIARAGFSPAATLRSGPFNRRFAPPARLSGFRCCLQEGDGDSIWEERPETMFMKELRRRGMTPMLTSLLEESYRAFFELRERIEEVELEIEEVKEMKRNGVVSAAADQRELSPALNTEGLEGFNPWTNLLLTLGRMFFMAYWPLILITIVIFAVIYSVS